ncbi:hypothetical protein ABT324_30855 [Saccharopolyspora sp. NPDC000359]|uniref:hypothetical protein n=1 Tax=Saccharopolyspora sp. NPDC000359 TaxID=3154251 RepID=UPI00333095B7
MSRDVGSPPSIDFADAMTGRYTDAEPTAPDHSAKPARSTSGPAQTRRSWLLPVDVAEAFAAAAARIHHGSGGTISKSEAQAALMQAGIDAEAEVTRRLLGHT